MEATHAVVEQFFRKEAGRVLANLISTLHDFELAEEALQEALIAALEHLLLLLALLFVRLAVLACIATPHRTLFASPAHLVSRAIKPLAASHAELARCNHSVVATHVLHAIWASSKMRHSNSPASGVCRDHSHPLRVNQSARFVPLAPMHQQRARHLA